MHTPLTPEKHHIIRRETLAGLEHPHSLRLSDSRAGQEKAWQLKDLRKTCATYYDEHMPESSIEILGHSVAGITYRRYAHRAPLVFRAITTLPQPSTFLTLVRGIEGECPCCKRPF